MRNLIQRFMIFMQGRYGTDTLNRFLFVLFIVLWLVNIFVFNFVARNIIWLIELLIIALTLFRSFSRNIYKRSAENRKFLKYYNPVKSWVKLNIRKFKDRKDYRYLKCPICKSQLRVKNKKGIHTVHCPRCGSEFDKKI
ncbi:MAG: zf-TFIIB domain-containing protein [Ruminococcus sp.]|nr:zf-TFIIB domain-containing protein [Ruminococcus sp.]